MAIKAVEERRAERARLVRVARDYAERLADRLPGVRSVVVAGSVSRGDFNVWSDIDVIVVADGLPDGVRDRLEVLLEGAPPGIEAFGYTPDELERELGRRNALVRDAVEHGVSVYGPGLAER
ncbi:MAG: nucleotidyltransferase domain-containing protein [Solirubrobacterales bacterium]